MIQYEWDIEEVDANGDVVDHSHSDTLFGFGRYLSDIDATHRLVLVRNEYPNSGGMFRSWCYAEAKDGYWVLPEAFLDAYQRFEAKVPVRFHKEIAKRMVKVY